MGNRYDMNQIAINNHVAAKALQALDADDQDRVLLQAGKLIPLMRTENDALTVLAAVGALVVAMDSGFESPMDFAKT